MKHTITGKLARSMMLLAGVALMLTAAVAWAHDNRQEGGPNGETLDGHAHRDHQLAKGGCDTVLGRDGSDESVGGDSGCDVVRGMEGGGDALIVCDDGAGNDWAYGGGGLGDFCIASLNDNFDLASCEYPRLEPHNCSHSASG